MDLQFCVPCLFGLEGLVADELRRMDAPSVSAENGRVYFTGDEGMLARANLRLRTGERVLLELGRFEALTFDQLFERTKALPWERWIPKDAAFPVTGHSLNSKLFSVSDCQKIIKKAVVERLKGRYHLGWFAETGETVQIRFSIMKDQVSLGLKGTKCTICVDEEEFQVTVPLPGEHMVLNAAAAAAVGSVCGLTPDEIRAGIESVEPVGGRLRITETGTYTLIEDYYNANPMSMKAALRILNHAEGRKVAVLGDMGELGTKERELHYEVGTAAGELDLGLVLLAGPLSEEIGRGLRDAGSSAEILQFPDTEQLAEALPSHVREGDQILIKASRFMQFEKAADVLKQ